MVGALVFYEILMVVTFEILDRHPPAALPVQAGHVLPWMPLLAGLIPLFLVLSFLGVLGRSRTLLTTFFFCFIFVIPFLFGTFLLKGLLLMVPFTVSDSWTISEEGGLLFFALGILFPVMSRLAPPIVHRKKLFFRDLSPDISGLTVLHLSDLHVGSWQTRGSLERIAKAVNEIAPDILVYTGDLIDHKGEEIARFEKIFGGLSGRLGTFAVLGNHEYWSLGPNASEIMKQAGVPILKNEARPVRMGDGCLWVVGIDDPAGDEQEQSSGPDADSAYRLVEDSREDLVLTLVHQPTLWAGKIKMRSHLTLSGHTHGGQIGRRVHRWNLASPFFSLDVGLFCLNRSGESPRYLHVSSGLGYFGVPLRIGVPPEMTLFTIEKGNFPPDSGKILEEDVQTVS